MQVSDELKESAPKERTSPSLVPLASRSLLAVQKRRSTRRSAWIWIVVLLFLSGTGGGYYVWKVIHPPLPVGISMGNGRIEADEIDIDTKFAGRVTTLMVDIGDTVTPGQILARMDTDDLQQSLSKAEAQIRQAQRAVDEAQANLVQQETQRKLAEQKIAHRIKPLFRNSAVRVGKSAANSTPQYHSMTKPDL